MMGESCRCHRAFCAPEVPHWLPMRDREPGAEVRVVAFVEDDPAVLRMVRVADGWWHGRGVAAPHPELTNPEPWAQVGLCWAWREHPVVDVTGWSVSAPPFRAAPVTDVARSAVAADVVAADVVAVAIEAIGRPGDGA